MFLKGESEGVLPSHDVKLYNISIRLTHNDFLPCAILFSISSSSNFRYLYAVLCKNQVVTEQNKDLLVETLRSISEILIWGDQNDGSVFDFFLEKNMLSYFVKIMRHKQGRFVCTQLLQTLNILFENIRQDTSLCAYCR